MDSETNGGSPVFSVHEDNNTFKGTLRPNVSTTSIGTLPDESRTVRLGVAPFLRRKSTRGAICSCLDNTWTYDGVLFGCKGLSH
jgi:hypothetical protein